MSEQSEIETILGLSEKNRWLLDPDWQEYPGNDHKSIASLDAATIPVHYLAFHLAIPNQTLLKASTVDWDIPFGLGHVFFSTRLEDLDFYKDKDKEGMVYFADLRRVHESRVQKSYTDKVIFRIALLRRFGDYREGNALISDLQGQVDHWLRQYTANFNPNRLHRYKENGDYILIREPIRIVRNQAQK